MGGSEREEIKMRHSRQVSNLWGRRNFFFHDPEFSGLIECIETAVEHDINPKLIPQGSSGSYFALNIEEEIVGVFKPQDEEPFADNNPKWAKWFQRNLSPCCFGRSCLLPNHGYLSEAGASLVDEKLGLHIVPKTKVVSLASKNFSYFKSDRMSEEGLPLKIGSLQTFVKDFKDAGYWLRRWSGTEQLLDPDVQQSFLIKFQKMVILDYIIRNTDRSDANWLIKYDPGSLPESSTPEPETTLQKISFTPPREDGHSAETSSTQDSQTRSTSISLTASSDWTEQTTPGVSLDPTQREEEDSDDVVKEWKEFLSSDSTKLPKSLIQDKPEHSTYYNYSDISLLETDAEDTKGLGPSSRSPSVEVAAIDNGLAFPHKHPDSWRIYPFYWANLSYAKVQFDEDLAASMDFKLSDPRFLEELCEELRLLFKTDPDFKKRAFNGQMGVLRGQVFNLRKAFSEKATPAQLAQFPRCLVQRKGLGIFRRRRSRDPIASHPDEDWRSGATTKSCSSIASQWSSTSHHSRIHLDIPQNARWNEIYRKKNVSVEPKFSCC